MKLKDIPIIGTAFLLLVTHHLVLRTEGLCSTKSQHPVKAFW